MDNGPLGPKGRLRREAEQEWTARPGTTRRSPPRIASHGTSHRLARRIAQEVRGQEVLLHVLRRRWLDKENHNVMTECTLIQESTRCSTELADF